MATAPAHLAGVSYSVRSTLALSSLGAGRATGHALSACAPLRIRVNTRVRAGVEGGAERPVVRRKKPRDATLDAEATRPLETVAVEDERVAVEGVGKVDREPPSSSSSSWGRVGALAAGDLVALVTFAVIGRYSHGLTSLNWEALRTADPFIAGWLLGSFFLGGYGPDGQGLNGVPRAATTALKAWAAGVPLGLVIRSVVTAHLPAQAFVLVSLGSLLVLMVGWRVAFVYAVESSGHGVEKRSPGNRSGGVFEFLELLTSLVRRW